MIADALGVALIYFFVFDIPLIDGSKRDRLVVGGSDVSKLENKFYRFYRPHLFARAPDWLKLILSDFGLSLVLAGFALQYLGAN